MPACQETLSNFWEFPQTILHFLTIYEKLFVYLLLYLLTSSPRLTCFFTLSVHIYTGIIKGIKTAICNIKERMLQKEMGFFVIDTTSRTTYPLMKYIKEVPVEVSK